MAADPTPLPRLPRDPSDQDCDLVATIMREAIETPACAGAQAGPTGAALPG
ncbi:hypothetical protein [Bosea sp. (in: a-proteobacteria)]|uniref:hypothetical protein n=1 Tax=Bosea sp. (in: a-proteobacteria) TaxID=1871050 RepID=UPI002FCC97F0